MRVRNLLALFGHFIWEIIIIQCQQTQTRHPKPSSFALCILSLIRSNIPLITFGDLPDQKVCFFSFFRKPKKTLTPPGGRYMRFCNNTLNPYLKALTFPFPTPCDSLMAIKNSASYDRFSDHAHFHNFFFTKLSKSRNYP